MAETAAYAVRRRRRRWPLASLGRGARGRLAAAAILIAAVLVAAWIASAGGGDPREALAHARISLAAGNYTAARDQSLRALEAEPGRGEAHLVLARAYLELGDGSAADAVLTRARSAGVAPWRLRGLRAAARLLQNDTDAALALTASGQVDDRVFAGRVRARALAATGDAAAAQRLLVTLPGAGAAIDLGRVRLMVGDVGGAADAAARALAAERPGPAALTLQGEVVRSRYGPVAALPWFETALQRDRGYPPALLDHAATLAEVGRHREAVAAARAALAARPGTPQALYILAVIAARAGNPNLARAILQHAGDTLDTVAGALLLNGALNVVQGHAELAVAQWRQLLDAQPDNRTARALLGSALLRSGDPHGALDTLRPLASRGDADSYALEVAARAAWLAGNRAAWADLHDRAITAARAPSRVIAPMLSVATLSLDAATSHGDPSRALLLIRGLVASGDTAGAIGRAAGLATALPGTPAVHVVLGDTLFAANRYGEAAAAYARAANLSFDEPNMLKLVDALGAAGRNGEAAQALAVYAGQNPQSATALRIAGHWQVAAGEYAGALVTLQRARGVLGSRNAALLADLARAYAGAGQGNLARHYGHAAYSLAPMDAAVVDAYAAALHADGDADGARQLRAKLRQLPPIGG